MEARLPPTSGEPHTRLKQVSLWSATRLAMLDAIRTRPGLSASDIARAIDRNVSTVGANLHLLVQAGLVCVERDGRLLRVYPVGGMSARERFIAKLGPSARVFEALEEGTPGRPVPVAHACGITRHAARYHLERLASLGAIRSVERRILVTERTYLVSDAES